MVKALEIKNRQTGFALTLVPGAGEALVLETSTGEFRVVADKRWDVAHAMTLLGGGNQLLVSQGRARYIGYQFPITGFHMDLPTGDKTDGPFCSRHREVIGCNGTEDGYLEYTVKELDL